MDKGEMRGALTHTGHAALLLLLLLLLGLLHVLLLGQLRQSKSFMSSMRKCNVC